MNHTITIGGLLLSLGALGGLVAIVVGMLMAFAAGMSDAGDDGTGARGCITFIAGVVVLAGCLLAMLL